MNISENCWISWTTIKKIPRDRATNYKIPEETQRKGIFHDNMNSPERQMMGDIILDGLLGFLHVEDPSDYTDFYEELDWRNYQIDQNVYRRHGHANRTEQRVLGHLLTQARKEIMDLEWKLARLGSDSYKYSGQEMTDLQQENIELHRKNARLEAENDVLKEQIGFFRNKSSDRAYKAAVSHMHDGCYRESDHNQDNSQDTYEVIEVLNPVERRTEEDYQPRNGTRFTSKSGATKKENMMASAAYYENGYSIPEIADLLELSQASVRSYLSTIRRHYKIELIREGRMICFDREFGSVTWSLAFYERTHIDRPVNGDLTAY